MTVAIEEKLRDLGSKVEAEPFALKPLGRAGRRWLFGRRMVVGGLAAAVLVGIVGGVVLGAGIRRGERETFTPSERLESYLDPGYGWEMSYPSNWHLQPIVDCPADDACERGTLVSNLDRDVRQTSGVLLTDTPLDFVGVEFAYTRYVHLGETRLDLENTDFPLSLESLNRAGGVATRPLTRYWGDVVVDGRQVFRMDVWIGPDASPDAIGRIKAVISSVTKPIHSGQYPLGLGRASVPVGDQEASVQLRIDPPIFSEGDAPRLVLENPGPLDLFYSDAFKLEMKEPSGRWRYLNQEHEFRAPVSALPPGESSGQVLTVFDGVLPVDLSSGTYRITKSFGVEGSERRLTVRALFLVVEDVPRVELSTGLGKIAFVLGRPIGPAFQTNPSDPPVIYTMDGDGGNVQEIIPNDNTWSLYPTSWSPDGTQLMYLKGYSHLGAWDVVVSDAAGANPRTLYECGTANCLRPGPWSPDGEQVLFVDGLNVGVADADFINMQVVTDCDPDADTAGDLEPSDCYGVEGSPDWSPDGRRIAYTPSDVAGNGYLVVMNVDGSDPVTIDSCSEEVCLGTYRNSSPSWSPDGTMIAFAKKRNIYVVSLEGGDPVRLTDCSEASGYQACTADRPQWSPDGRTILYETAEEGLFTIDLVGGDPQRIGPAGAYGAVWSSR